MLSNKLKICILFSVAFFSCSKDSESPVVNDQKQTKLEITPISELNLVEHELNSHEGETGRSSLKLNYRTLCSIQQNITGDNPVYPRFVKLDNGEWLLFYHNGVKRSDGTTSWAGNECSYLRSSDLMNWNAENKLFAVYPITDCLGKANNRGFAGAFPLLLQNGTLICAASYRAITDYRNREYDNGIVIKTSTDNGITWSDEQLIYRGTNWEPFLVQLPNGRVECYFTDSNDLVKGPWTTIYNNSGISMIYSDDNGKTWQPSYGNKPIKVIRQLRDSKDGVDVYTDQMPALIALNGQKKMAAAAESFIGGDNYISYISLASSDDDYTWEKLTINDVGPKDRQNNVFLGCAPYLMQMPSGEVVLSYNGSNSNFYMRIGDVNCRNFSDEKEILSKSTNRGFWGAMQKINGHSVVAAIGGANNSIRLGQLFLNHDIKASRKNITVDGNNNDWDKNDEALFLGSVCQCQATLRCATDDDNLYFLIEVKDDNISADDNVQIFMSGINNEKLNSKSVRLKFGPKGFKNSSIYAGSWKELDLGQSSVVAFDGTISDSQDVDNGWIVEVKVPKSSLVIENGEILLNFSLFDTEGGVDSFASTSDKSTGKWIKITGC